MHDTWSIPAKTFLVGEYAALKEQSAILLTTTPCFELRLTSQPGLHGIHPQSPAGRIETLRLLGLTQARCEALGIEIYKVGMVWPLEPSAALTFVESKKEILVVEEKRGIIESQLKEYFYDQPGSKPNCMVGKYDELGNALFHGSASCRRW